MLEAWIIELSGTCVRASLVVYSPAVTSASEGRSLSHAAGERDEGTFNAR